MDHLAELDTSFLVPCRHCAALLQGRELFCPFCGEDQSVAVGAGDAHLLPASNHKKAGSGFGLDRPGALWQDELPAGRGPAHWADSSVSRKRLAISIVAVLVLLALVLMLNSFYVDRQNEAGKLRAFETKVEQVRGALGRGDLNTAEQVLDELDADHADHPGVQALRETFDRRVQEQAARREQLRDAALKASRALGFGQAPAPPAQPALPPEPQMPAAPAPATGVADPKDNGCNETLAALALCAKK